jgi:sodium/potassium-transporting ATPase subunit alpha
MPEVLPYLLYVVIPIPVAIGALQILVVDLGFELFAALSYAFEVPESQGGLMRLPPRKPVTPESIKRKKAREAEQAAHALILPHDTEAGSDEEQRPSKLQLTIHTCKQITQGWWWKQALSASEGDVLVDLDALSYSYLEGGIIEFMGALTTFFVVFWNGMDPATGRSFRISPWDSVHMQGNGNYFASGAPSYTTVTGNVLSDSAQVEALAQAQSGFYFSVMIIQMFNLFACKARFRQPFGRYMFQNSRTWGSIITGAGFAVIIVYAPPFNIAFQTSYHLSPLYWLIPIAFGVILIGYNSLRQLVKQFLQPVQWNPEIAGLQMYPTHWSTRR